MEQKHLPTYTVRIHMAGDIEHAKQICRRYCFDHGLCVTVAPQTFIYTGGEEAGFVVGLLAYPRFPRANEDLFSEAQSLADELRVGLCQLSYLLEATDQTVWVSKRDENPNAK